MSEKRSTHPSPLSAIPARISSRDILLIFCLMTGVPAAQKLQSGVPGSQLGEGVRLEAGTTPIDVTVGHAAPYLIDLDGDGNRDLLVGQFGGGKFDDRRLPAATLEKWGPGSFSADKLRIYMNDGTNAAPRFEDFQYLKAHDQDASVPTT